MFLSENFLFLEVKFSIYLNRRVFVMRSGPSLSAYAQGHVFARRGPNNTTSYYNHTVNLASLIVWATKMQALPRTSVSGLEDGMCKLP